MQPVYRVDDYMAAARAKISQLETALRMNDNTLGDVAAMSLERYLE